MGAQGRKHIQHLINMGAVSLEEAMRRCPDLQIRPMRTTRYRQVLCLSHVVLCCAVLCASICLVGSS